MFPDIDLEKTKVCITCGQRKPIEEFHRRGKDTERRYNQCKTCWAERTKKWEKENPERFKEAGEKRRLDGRRRRYRLTALLKTFGLTLEWYDKQMEIQKGECAACGVYLDELNPTGKAGEQHVIWPTVPCIHHSHSHGDVVDILCSGCNIAEGWLKTPERAHSLWRYMSRDALFYASKKGLELDKNVKISTIKSK